jgi:serine/threonine protein kinase
LTLRRQGYDGKKVDVWASGVLLFVMLLGMFPFEMEDENYVNTAGMYSIWWVAAAPVTPAAKQQLSQATGRKFSCRPPVEMELHCTADAIAPVKHREPVYRTWAGHADAQLHPAAAALCLQAEAAAHQLAAEPGQRARGGAAVGAVPRPAGQDV